MPEANRATDITGAEKVETKKGTTTGEIGLPENDCTKNEACNVVDSGEIPGKGRPPIAPTVGVDELCEAGEVLLGSLTRPAATTASSV